MVDRARLADALDRLAGARVAVVGDVMLDRYVYGEADRISPEAPVPVLLVTDEEPMLGGAGNVVRNLVALNAKCHFLSAVGSDSDAEQVTRLLAALAGAEAKLVAVTDRPTSRKTRFVAGGHQLLRVDRENAKPLGATDENQIIDRIPQALSGAGAVVLSDYGKGVLTDRVITSVIHAASEANIPVLVDPKGLNYSRYRGASLITPNRTELREATAMPTGTSEAVAAAAREVIRRCGIAAVLGTRGPQGMTLVDGTGMVHNIAAASREVFDVSGAGDTVIATVAAGVAAGLSLIDAAFIANSAAGVVVGKIGTAVAYPDEIRAALLGTDWREGKVVDLPRALERAARWRAQGQRVGFTNGCFDILHPGHVHLIKQARATCDRLVVGLNSDASVRRLKGSERPVNDEDSRAAVLAGLADVDLVTVFAEDTPEALIAALRPDVLVKGADYTMDTVVGADLVKGYGGRVVLAELLPGHSTSATVARLK